MIELVFCLKSAYALNTKELFVYPDLDPSQKLEFERMVAPFDLERTELAHLLSTSFPFDGRTRLWLEHYLELSEIYQQQGPLANLSSRMDHWVWKQRSCRKQGRLPLERERALNRIGMVWNVNEAVWQKQYEAYVAYQNDAQAKMTKLLSAWLYSMRKKWDELNPRKRRLLQQAGLIRQPFAKIAQERLRQLEALFAKQGNLRGLNRHLQDFVERVRHLYKIGKLNPEVQKRCDDVRLKWSANNPSEQWLSFYARAAAYVQKYGHAIPVWKWPDRELSKWMGRQTGRWSSLSSERKNLLKKLHIKTQEEQMQAIWNRRYAQAAALHARLGPFRKRVYQNEDEALKGWLRRQRLKWDQLREDQRIRLLAIGLNKTVVGGNRDILPARKSDLQ